MDGFEVLGDAVRRRLVAMLATGEQPAGALTDIVRAEFGISQPAVSQHLRVLRENGFATVRADGARRFYALDAGGLDAVEAELARLRSPLGAVGLGAGLGQRLDALHTEIRRGASARRRERAASAGAETPTEEAS